MLDESVVGLFPGQGAYRPEAYAALRARDHETVQHVFSTIDQVHRARGGQGLGPMLSADRPPDLEQMRIRHPDELQLMIFGLSVAAHQVEAACGTVANVLIGHSLGEIAALVAAGAFSIADGASIVCDRTAVLRERAPEGGMLALRCSRARADLLVELAELQGLVVAVDNAEEQVVLSGSIGQLTTARSLAEALEIGTAEVSSPYGFHNPALITAGRQFAAKVAEYAVRPLAAVIVSPILGRAYNDGDDLATLLGLHLSNPVLFRDAMFRLYSAGHRTFVEFGAGDALTKLVRSTFPLASVRSAAGVEFNLSAPPSPTATPPVPLPAAPAAVPSGPTLGRAEVFKRLRELYAEALEYPVEVLTEDAGLESELGVDSMRQTELLSAVRTIFELPPPARGFRSTELNTLAKVTDYVLSTSP